MSTDAARIEDVWIVGLCRHVSMTMPQVTRYETEFDQTFALI